MNNRAGMIARTYQLKESTARRVAACADSRRLSHSTIVNLALERVLDDIDAGLLEISTRPIAHEALGLIESRAVEQARTA